MSTVTFDTLKFVEALESAYSDDRDHRFRWSWPVSLPHLIFPDSGIVTTDSDDRDHAGGGRRWL